MTESTMSRIQRGDSPAPLRVTLKSSQNDKRGIIAWLKENELEEVFLVEFVNEGEALVSRWTRSWRKMKGPMPALLCDCGRPEHLLYIRERVQIRSLPPQACLERVDNR